jgi:GNAT superfamily N-acetyltransferase
MASLAAAVVLHVCLEVVVTRKDTSEIRLRTRALEYADLDALLALYTHLFDSDDPLPERAGVVEVWQRMLASPMLHCFGLELDDVLIASCTLTITPNLTRGTRSWGQIENVVTHRAYRRRGLGRTLIHHALALAWELGCYKVMLMTGRAENHRFYEHCGFQKDVKTGFIARP